MNKLCKRSKEGTSGKLYYSIITAIMTVAIMVTSLVIGNGKVYAATNIGDVVISGVKTPEPASETGKIPAKASDLSIDVSSQCEIDTDINGNINVTEDDESRVLHFINGVCWYNETDHYSLMYGDEFESGKNYSFKVLLKAKDDYSLFKYSYVDSDSDRPHMYINNKSSVWETRARYFIEDDYKDRLIYKHVLAEYSFAFVSDATVTLSLPTDGNHPEEVASVQGKKYQDYMSASNVKWYDSNGNLMTSSDTFVKGNKYKVTMSITSRYGWMLSKDKTNFKTFNGITATNVSIIVLPFYADSVSFELTAGDALKNVTVIIDDPVPGKNVPSKVKSITTSPSGLLTEEDIEKIDISGTWYEADKADATDWKSEVKKITRGKAYKTRALGDVSVYAIEKCLKETNETNITGVADDCVFTLKSASSGATHSFTFADAISLSFKDWYLNFGIIYEYYSKVEVKVDAPVDGNKPTTNAKITGADKNKLKLVEFKSGEEVIWPKVDWRVYNETTTEYDKMKEDESFVAGKKYRVFISIQGQSGCEPNPEGVKYFVNDKETTKDPMDFALKCDFIAVPKVKELKFTIPEPVIGETPGKISIEADVKNAVKKSLIDTLNSTSSWFVSNDGENYEAMKLTDKFEAGKYYKNGALSNWALMILIYRIADNSMYDENYGGGDPIEAKYFVNGKEVDITSESSVAVDFGLLEAPATPEPTKTPEEVTPTPEAATPAPTKAATPTPTASPTPTQAPVPDEGTDLVDTKANAVYTVVSKGNTDASDPEKKENPTIEYKCSENENAKKITIPDTVTIDGITYDVVGVAPKALKGRKKLVSVTIGTKVKYIGKSAFENCPSLKTVNCKSKVLEKIGAKAFYKDKKLVKMTFKTTKLKAKKVGKNAIKGTSSSLVIKVPKKVKKSYLSIFKAKGNKNVKTK